MQLASRFASRSPVLRADHPLSDDQIRAVAPSIFAEDKHASRSERYSYIPTAAVLTELRKEGHVHRGKIGISVQSISPSLAEGLGLARDWGVLVGDVTPDGPADNAGVKVGDTVLAINNTPIAQLKPWNVHDLLRHDPGTRVQLRLRRSDQSVQEVTLTLRDLL